jgi:hypothetical protein
VTTLLLILGIAGGILAASLWHSREHVRGEFDLSVGRPTGLPLVAMKVDNITYILTLDEASRLGEQLLRDAGAQTAFRDAA